MAELLARFTGDRRKELGRFAKFMVVGGVGFVVDTGTLNLLVLGLHLTDSAHRLLAKTLSFTLAVVSNFLWNRYWTYPDSRSKPISVQLVQFFVVNSVGLGINLLIFDTVSNWTIPQFRAALGATQGLALGTNIAQVCVVTVVLFWNFFINRVWTYGDVT